MSLQEKYKKEVIKALKTEFGLKNDLSVPRVTKALVTVGLSSKNKDPKLVETVENTLLRITGQRPAKTAAKKSISNFKIRKGMTVGFMVTLRGHRMYDFLDKLVNLTLPRVRDFRGLPRKSVDHKGNLSIGFREHVAFPEIRPDEVERLHGLGITVVTNAKSREKGLALFAGLGFPFAAK
jgi:large subunit ribosomal protein L5